MYMIELLRIISGHVIPKLYMLSICFVEWDVVISSVQFWGIDCSNARDAWPEHIVC